MNLPTVSSEDTDEYVCVCGNQTHTSGFEPSLEDGTPTEPTLTSAWVDCYVCRDCGRVFRVIP